MTDKKDGGPYGPALNLQKVNGVGGVSPEIWIRGDNIGAPGTTYPDGSAPASALGCVKAGKNVTIDPDGTINAEGGGPATVTWNDIQDKPATFVPPIATKDAIGGVKPGKNLTVGADGTLDATGAAITPATPTNLGGIKVGKGLNVTGDGVLSTEEAAPSWNDVTDKPATFTPPIANASTLGGVKAGRGVNIEADGTLNTESAAPYWNEILEKPAAFPPPVASTNTLGGVKQGAGVKISGDGTLSTDIQTIDWDIIVDKPEAYPPTIAEEGKVGGVKPGNNISIDPDGTINAAAVDLPPATTYTLGGVKVGAGLTVQEDGTIGTEAAAPYWLDIVDKPKAFPPTNAAEGVVGGIMPDDQFTVNESGMLSAKPFKGKPFQVIVYDDGGNILGSATMQNKNGNLVLGGIAPSAEHNGDEVAFGGQLTLLDKTGAYQAVIKNDSFDYALLLTNGPNVKKGFMPFVTQVENSDVSLAFGPISDAIGYGTKDKIGVVQVGGNIDVSAKGVVSVKTATKDELGVVRVGGGLDVKDGLVTPSLATTAAPGVVQVGSGLDVDANGVISATNAMAFVNRKVFTNDGFYPASYEWELPEGVDYFRVRVQGAGANGGRANDSATSGPGGGGAGAGAYMETIFYGYKFEKGAVFDVYCGGPNSGAKSGAATFFLRGGKVGIGGEGGNAGEAGSDAGPIGKGYSCGGRGGQPISNGVDLSKMLTPQSAAGGDGMPGTSIDTLKGRKTFGGVGGSSVMAPSYWGGRGGFGFGSMGGGETDVYSGTAWGGGSCVIIEW